VVDEGWVAVSALENQAKVEQALIGAGFRILQRKPSDDFVSYTLGNGEREVGGLTLRWQVFDWNGPSLPQAVLYMARGLQ